MFVPFFNFGKMFLDITTLTTGRLDAITSTFIPGPGFPWSAVYNVVDSSLLPTYADGIPLVPPPVQSLYFLIMNVAFYGALTWYFDKVIPNEYGYSRPYLFLFTPSYWRTKSTEPTEEDQKKWLSALLKKDTLPIENDEEPDVKKERNKSKQQGKDFHFRYTKFNRNNLCNQNY